jgi:hypothetical protein
VTLTAAATPIQRNALSRQARSLLLNQFLAPHDKCLTGPFPAIGPDGLLETGGGSMNDKAAFGSIAISALAALLIGISAINWLTLSGF